MSGNKMDSAVPDQTDSCGDRQDESKTTKQDEEATQAPPGTSLDVPAVTGQSRVKGSLTLCYEDNIKHTIPYDSSIQGCQTIDLPQQYQEMAFDRLELAHGKFVLYSRKNGSGRAKTVESISGYREYSAEDIGFSVVKSVKILGKVSFAPVKVHKGRLYFSVIIRHRD